MPKGMSIHIGLNQVDEAEYGEPKKLLRAEADAEAMAAIARTAGFDPVLVFPTAKAKIDPVVGAIEHASASLDPGDIFLLTFSGHGAFVFDTNGDETDGRDETWCLYDRELVDDKLYALLATFDPGVRILIISDSCRSGTVAQFIQENRVLRSLPHFDGDADREELAAVRALTVEHAIAVYRAHADTYDQIQQSVPNGRKIDVDAHVLLLSACQDWEFAYEGDHYGVFTTALLDALQNAGATNYLELHAAIFDRLKQVVPRQHPGYMKIGVPNPQFEFQKPFTI